MFPTPRDAPASHIAETLGRLHHAPASPCSIDNAAFFSLCLGLACGPRATPGTPAPGLSPPRIAFRLAACAHLPCPILQNTSATAPVTRIINPGAWGGPTRLCCAVVRADPADRVDCPRTLGLLCFAADTRRASVVFLFLPAPWPASTARQVALQAGPCCNTRKSAPQSGRDQPPDRAHLQRDAARALARSAAR